MFYVSLNNINKEKKFQIPQEKLKVIDELLTILLPNQTISPRYLARKAKIEYEIMKKLLMELSFRSLLGVIFIVLCDNEDPDMVHALEFESDLVLADFIQRGEKCPDCGADLLLSNIRVAFVKKENKGLNGEFYA